MVHPCDRHCADRRSADGRVGALAVPVHDARAHPGGRDSGAGCTGAEDRWSDDAYGPCGPMTGRPHLDREKHPQWPRRADKMVYTWAHGRSAVDSLRRTVAAWHAGGPRNSTEATEFYRANRGAMDVGALIAWPERHHPDELSAIQHDHEPQARPGRGGVWAEYQNEPLPEEQATTSCSRSTRSWRSSTVSAAARCRWRPRT